MNGSTEHTECSTRALCVFQHISNNFTYDVANWFNLLRLCMKQRDHVDNEIRQLSAR